MAQHGLTRNRKAEAPWPGAYDPESLGAVAGQHREELIECQSFQK